VSNVAQVDTPGGTRPAQHYGEIVVCGGGCYGGYYVRQLLRARAAGALVVSRIIVVDRDPHAPAMQLAAAIVAGDAEGMRRHAWRTQRADNAEVSANENLSIYTDAPLDAVCEDWSTFLNRWFAQADGADAAPQSSVVPSPLMPNLLADWVESRVRARHPTATVSRQPLSVTPDTPWQRSGGDASHYASFATWMCPINCIEPPRCPETRGPRDWSMPVSVTAAARAAEVQGTPYDVIALFHTTHRLYGVGMFDRNSASRVDEQLARAAVWQPLRVLVASVSHCHGAFAECVADPGTA
jgi:hypothetical protein